MFNKKIFKLYKMSIFLIDMINIAKLRIKKNNYFVVFLIFYFTVNKVIYSDC